MSDKELTFGCGGSIREDVPWDNKEEDSVELVGLGGEGKGEEDDGVGRRRSSAARNRVSLLALFVFLLEYNPYIITLTLLPPTIGFCLASLQEAKCLYA